MLIQERIRLILKANRLNASEFADRVGVNRASLSHVLSGRNKPGLDFLAKIINEFPNVNASWLITGETREGGFAGAEAKQEVKTPNTDEVKDQLSSDNNPVNKPVRIVVFYEDDTFKEYFPSAQ